MNSGDRWLASVRGIRPEYSKYLRRGLGEILILFSLFGNQVPSVVNPAARVENIVQKLLENADEERWWSLSRDFQLLAEAAPEAFLSALDQELDQLAAVTVLFGEDKGSQAGVGREYVSNLLWALESIHRMKHKSVERDVRFSYYNQHLVRTFRLRSWRTRRVNRTMGFSGSILTAG